MFEKNERRLIVLKIILTTVATMMALLLSNLAWTQSKIPQSYQQQSAWQQLQQRLPLKFRINDQNKPHEYYWNWNDYRVHVDAYPNTKAPAKVILLHGVGTNGRQMSLILGRPLAQKGYETFALDLPGYGLTQYPSKKEIRYDHWVKLVNDFVNEQAQKDDRPIFLYGLSAGGMLTLHVAMQNKHVDGIIGMTFLDQEFKDVQKGTMRFSALSPVLLPSMKAVAHTPLKQITLPMSLVSKMSKLTNDPEALRIMLADKTSAGNSMSVEFLNSYMHYQKPYPLTQFNQAPVLLTQPEQDQWTPLKLSQPVLKQLKVPYRVMSLQNGGHYPVEQPALDQLVKYSDQFIRENIKR